MKILANLSGTATDDGNPSPKFSQSTVAMRGQSLNHPISARGIFVTNNTSTVLIPWTEIDKLAQSVEPSLKPT